MPDIADCAQRIIDADLERSLEVQRHRYGIGAGSGDCIDCGERIPPARRAAAPGAARCVGCQSAFEKTGR